MAFVRISRAVVLKVWVARVLLIEYCWEKNFSQHADVVCTGISTKGDEELIDLSEDSSFKVSFDRKTLTQFWLSVLNTYPTPSTAALKVLHPFTTFYLCEIGFSAMNKIKSKFRSKLQLSNILRLQPERFSADVEEVITQNRKQAHCSHTPHYAFDK
ncbi:Zinc finger BED domain-containing protein 5 [Trichinella spiralis]|uniref:Zinc finger BED domain-containing protein 5 n=1 Tax=Trichinella spiralis TaxID=6334 RepID=A0A0V1BHP2_TRISP|nr:Zinc finger BED domain-containing protein 5 [Trichinella spiralis]